MIRLNMSYSQLIFRITLPFKKIKEKILLKMVAVLINYFKCSALKLFFLSTKQAGL